MLNNKGFDLWADGYDKTVGISDEENTYPFAGYKKVLGFIFQTIMETRKCRCAGYWIRNRHINDKTIRARLFHLWTGFFIKNDCIGI